MIERLYVNNFRCLENFSLDLAEQSSALIIGKNGSGKSTSIEALRIFQSICRGSSRVKALIDESDFAQQRTNIPMRFEVEVVLANKRFKYAISFEMPENFLEARIAEEELTVDGEVIFSRDLAQVRLPGGPEFSIDWHIVALPVIVERSEASSIKQIKAFFASMILIAPIPAHMSGFSEEECTELEADAGNFSSWFNAVLSRYPASYTVLYEYLTFIIPDLYSFENVPRGEKGKQLLIKFEQKESNQVLSVEFNQLSDGEKCFFLSAMIIASSKVSGPLFCMWDEPDNHLSLPEVGHFVIQLRKLMNQNSQFIATSHHPETIRRFSDDSTFVFTRNSHLEPTVARSLEDLQYNGDLVEALIRDEIL